MFDSVVMRFKKEYNNSIGELMELLVYYNHVYVIFGLEDVSYVIKKLGIDNFQKLVSIKHLTAMILPEFIGVRTNTLGIFQTHAAIIGRIHAHEDGKKIKLKDFAIENICKELQIRPNNKIENILTTKCKITTYNKIGCINNNVNDLITETASNNQLLLKFINSSLSSNGVVIDDNVFNKFEYIITRDSTGFTQHSDDLKKLINIPPPENYSWAHLFANIHDYWIENFIASYIRSDLVTNYFYSQVSETQFGNALSKSKGKLEDVYTFQKYVFSNAKYISEAIDDDEIDFKSATKLIERNSKLREWVLELPPSSDLMQEYMSKINEEDSNATKIGKTFTKGTFIAAGALIPDGGLTSNILTGAATDAVGNFIERTFLGKYNPSTFVKSTKKLIK